MTERAAWLYGAAVDISSSVIMDVAVHKDNPGESLVRNVASFGAGALVGAAAEKLLKGAKGLGRWARRVTGNADDDVARAMRNMDDDVARAMRNADAGDDVARNLPEGFCPNSFSEDTPVATEDGEVPISEIEVGDEVLAYNEATGETGEYTVTDTFAHLDPVIIHLVIDGELIETTPEHPFFANEGEWIEAEDLEVGDFIWSVDGSGTVESIAVLETDQWMYNLTVDEAHTFYVGDGQWLVHNAVCPTVYRGGPSLEFKPNEVRIDKDTGLVQPGYGVSLNADPAKVAPFGGIYEVDQSTVSADLEINQRGKKDPLHYEIMVAFPMEPERYQELLNQIRLTLVEK